MLLYSNSSDPLGQWGIFIRSFLLTQIQIRVLYYLLQKTLGAVRSDHFTCRRSLLRSCIFSATLVALHSFLYPKRSRGLFTDLLGILAIIARHLFFLFALQIAETLFTNTFL